jgi:peroxiredoxin
MSDSPIVARPLLNGVSLPDFTLLNSQNQLVSLADLHQTNGVVVAFIHATWCPFCLRQLRRLNSVAPRLAELGIGLACISADPPDILYAYEQSSDPPLRYSLLADSLPSLAHKFGIFDPNPDHESPYPAVFYAGADNKIVYTDVSGDPDCFPNMERLIEVIENGVGETRSA